MRLILSHRRLPNLKSMVGTASGWHAHLSILVDHLNGRAHRGFWTEIAAVRPRYEELMRQDGAGGA